MLPGQVERGKMEHFTCSHRIKTKSVLTKMYVTNVSVSEDCLCRGLCISIKCFVGDLKVSNVWLYLRTHLLLVHFSSG